MPLQDFALGEGGLDVLRDKQPAVAVAGDQFRLELLLLYIDLECGSSAFCYGVGHRDDLLFLRGDVDRDKFEGSACAQPLDAEAQLLIGELWSADELGLARRSAAVEAGQIRAAVENLDRCGEIAVLHLDPAGEWAAPIAIKIEHYDLAR